MSQRTGEITTGTLHFSVESRVLRELGERLVKAPEVALVELIKNAYDADATTCEILVESPTAITIHDSGHGMTLKEFKNGWMRIGTSSKETEQLSRTFSRIITGEKGIGRFAVRFLGSGLEIRTVADDPERGVRTVLIANFDWPKFDKAEDLGSITVPFRLVEAGRKDAIGTNLRITNLRDPARFIDFNKVRTASISVVSPLAALLEKNLEVTGKRLRLRTVRDPGFSLRISPTDDSETDPDTARGILDNAVIRALLEIDDQRLNLQVFRRGVSDPVLKINDEYQNSIGHLRADIRFFPKRKGAFSELPVDGRVAQSWVRDHSGVAVFDRTFRVLPYGTSGDDWLRLAADTARRHREPRSSLAKKHLQMDDAVKSSTKLNYMLRLPYPEQLIGVVQVQGQRINEKRKGREGLVAAADREGFVANAAFGQLYDVVRGAVEAIASVDRELQQEKEREEREAAFQQVREETRAAIHEVESSPHIRPDDKRRIVAHLTQTQSLVQEQEKKTRESEERLQVMSLLGVVAGFMTHEFGTAIEELNESQRELTKLAKRDKSFDISAQTLSKCIARLGEFVLYSQGYILGANSRPTRPFPVRPRILQVVRVFGKYAEDRGISVDTEDVDPGLVAPLVPVSLYNGLALNLFTNALKAVVARLKSPIKQITFKAWNERKWHHLEVCDSGVGIPHALRRRVFEPLFTTTSSNRDPLGSGLGLGLSLIRHALETYGGDINVIDPPAGFSTCVHARLPLFEE